MAGRCYWTEANIKRFLRHRVIYFLDDVAADDLRKIASGRDNRSRYRWHWHLRRKIPDRSRDQRATMLLDVQEGELVTFTRWRVAPNEAIEATMNSPRVARYLA
jgi:hypothetical protein